MVETLQSKCCAHHSRETARLSISYTAFLVVPVRTDYRGVVLTLLDLLAVFDTLYHNFLLTRQRGMDGKSGKVVNFF